MKSYANSGILSGWQAGNGNVDRCLYVSVVMWTGACMYLWHM